MIEGDQGNDEESLGQTTRRFWRDRYKGQCIRELQADGWRVYTKGFPTIIAEKGCFMRMIVVNPRVNLGKNVTLGLGKRALSEVFFRCFGVKYEVWENPEPEVKDGDWV